MGISYLYKNENFFKTMISEDDSLRDVFEIWEKFFPGNENFFNLEFKYADKNNDGELSQEELIKCIEEFFKMHLLYTKEDYPDFEEITKKVQTELLEKYDANKDGKINKEEFANLRKHLAGMEILKYELSYDENVIEQLKKRKEKDSNLKAICEDMLTFIEKADISFIKQHLDEKFQETNVNFTEDENVLDEIFPYWDQLEPDEEFGIADLDGNGEITQKS